MTAAARGARSSTRRRRLVALGAALALLPAALAGSPTASADEVPHLLHPTAEVFGSSELLWVQAHSQLSCEAWSGPGWVPGTTIARRWLDDNGTEIVTSRYLTVSISDLGTSFTCEATATTPAGDTQTVRSLPKRVTLGSGTAYVGYSADRTYSPGGPAFLLYDDQRLATSVAARAGEIRTTYTWLRDGVAIAGGGGETTRPWSHRLTDGDAGHHLSLRMSVGQAATGISATYTSDPTPTVGTWSLTATIPATPLKVDNALAVEVRPTQAYPDAFSDDLFGRFTTTQQWLRNGVPIYGATRDAYTLTRLDVGKRLSVRVTVRSPGYVTRTLTTAQTAVMPGTYQPVSLSGDRYRDIAVREQGYLLTRDGFNGGIDWGGAQSAKASWGSWVTALAVGDMSGDGQEDFVVRDAQGYLWAYRTDPIEYSANLGRFRIGSGWNGMDRVLAGADFDGDRYGDVMARRRSDGALLFYAGRGPLGLAPGKVVGTGFGNRRIVTVAGDMNRDGRADLYSMTTAGNLYFHAGLGNGRVAAGVLVERGWQGYTAVLRAGDLTGDGRADLLARDASGWLWLYPGEGNGHVGTRKISNRVLDNNRVAFKVPSAIY